MRDPDLRMLHAADVELGHWAMFVVVRPFYLELMGFNISSVDARRVRRVGRASRRVAEHQVLLMLRGTWRPLVMGAWCAIASDDEAFSEAVHDALETCRGHLTAPPLITATVFYPSARTVPLLRDYAATDRLNGWGAADLADAAAHRVMAGSSEAWGAVDEHCTAARQLDALVGRGALLRAGRRGRWRAPGGFPRRI